MQTRSKTRRRRPRKMWTGKPNLPHECQTGNFCGSPDQITHSTPFPPWQGSSGQIWRSTPSFVLLQWQGLVVIFSPSTLFLAGARLCLLMAGSS